jgi:hypothetical protein
MMRMRAEDPCVIADELHRMSWGDYLDIVEHQSRYTDLEYRVERYANDAEAGRAIANFFRRLLGLKIVRTPKEAGDDVRRSYLRSSSGQTERSSSTLSAL